MRGRTAVVPRHRRRSLWKDIKMDWMLYAFMIPGLLYFLIFSYLPMYGVTMAFQDYNIYLGFAGSKWVGFQNFQRLFGNFLFSRALRNTIIISLLKFAAGFPAPIIFALLINEVQNPRCKKIVQTVTCLPHFISWVVMYGLLQAVLSPSTGLIKGLYNLFGEYNVPNLLTTKSAFRSILVISSTWKGFGYGSIIYLATISGIDPQLYEAAALDGAGKLRQTWHVTLPGLRPIITIQMIMSMGGILSAGFDQIFVVYNPLVYEVSEILDTYVYKLGMEQMKYSMSTAAGLFKSVIGLVLVIGTNWLAKRIEPDGALL